MNPEKHSTSERDQAKEELARYVTDGTPLPPETFLYFGKNNPRAIIQEIISEKLLTRMSVHDSEAVRRWQSLCQFASREAEESDIDQLILALADTVTGREEDEAELSEDNGWGWLMQDLSEH
jgi:hypothetical protein